MTNERAIKILAEYNVYFMDISAEELCEAIEMAIEALQAKTDGDTISRQDAIDKVGDWMVKEFGYLDLNRGERLIDAIEALPSAERTGKWKNSDFIPGMISCDQCGIQRNPKFKIGLGTWNFCPNCGARMDGEKATE